MHQALRATVLDFDPEVPIERASTPPATWYTDPDLAALERRAVWDRTWRLAARAEQVATPGAFVAVDLGDRPIVLVRGEDGTLRALHNVCRHKAAVVCEGAGTASELVCPYHGWAYHLDGRLKRAPRLAGIRDLDRDAMALPALRVATWGPWVFVNADPLAPPLAPELEPLEEPLAGLEGADLRFRGEATWRVACNWKVFCDNYLDGGYHVPHLHPGLGAQLDLDSYRTTLFERCSLQAAGASAPGAARIGSGAVYAFVYPDLMINRYGPVLDVNLVRPDGPERCVVTFWWWFDAGCDEDFVADSIASSRRTQEEDVAVSERVQRGLRSGAWERGRYAPALEMGIHHFHRLLAADLRGALAPTRPSSR